MLGVCGTTGARYAFQGPGNVRGAAGATAAVPSAISRRVLSYRLRACAWRSTGAGPIAVGPCRGELRSAAIMVDVKAIMGAWGVRPVGLGGALLAVTQPGRPSARSRGRSDDHDA